jgi:hypothetical protein
LTSPLASSLCHGDCKNYNIPTPTTTPKMGAGIWVRKAEMKGVTLEIGEVGRAREQGKGEKGREGEGQTGRSRGTSVGTGYLA